MENEVKIIDIIVPCYNEADNIDSFFQRMKSVENSIDGYTFNYIFIDDGSTDDTLKMIKELAAACIDDLTVVKYISFSRNFGKEAAMYAGLKASANGGGSNGMPSDYAVIIDADLQDPPELIQEMIETIGQTDCDVVAARRVSRKGEPRIRSLFARLFYKLMNRFGEVQISDGARDFRLMDRRVIKAIASMPETRRFSKGLFAWVGFDTQWVEFENVTRRNGETKWSMWSLTKYAIDGFIDFATSPLKFTGIFGAIISLGSVAYMIFEVLKVLIAGRDTPGYASTLCILLFFGGLIVAILSLIGEYIGRMYMEIKRRPIYIEKESNIED